MQLKNKNGSRGNPDVSVLTIWNPSLNPGDPNLSPGLKHSRDWHPSLYPGDPNLTPGMKRGRDWNQNLNPGNLGRSISAIGKIMKVDPLKSPCDKEKGELLI